MTEQARDPETSEQLQLGLRLYGNKIRFHHWPPGSGILCTKIYKDGTVELHGMSGAYHPGLFEIDEVTAVPLEGKVN